MSDAEKQPQSERPPDRARLGTTTPTSRFNTQGRDVEAHLSPNRQPRTAHDDQDAHPARHTRSQASLRREYSMKSPLPESRGGPDDGGRDSQGGDGEDLAWGPSHPCFPHPNPHVPRNSPEYADTRIIRVKRDWLVRGDLAPTYSNLYPEILDPLLPEHQFRTIIQKVNQSLVEAFDPYRQRNWVDILMGVLTGWFWEDLGLGDVKKRLRHLEQWLADWNRDVGSAEGVEIIPLRRTGYMSLDIQIPDPQVRIVSDEAGPEEEEGDDEQKEGGQQPPSVKGPEKEGEEEGATGVGGGAGRGAEG